MGQHPGCRRQWCNKAHAAQRVSSCLCSTAYPSCRPLSACLPTYLYLCWPISLPPLPTLTTFTFHPVTPSDFDSDNKVSIAALGLRGWTHLRKSIYYKERKERRRPFHARQAPLQPLLLASHPSACDRHQNHLTITNTTPSLRLIPQQNTPPHDTSAHHAALHLRRSR